MPSKRTGRITIMQYWFVVKRYNEIVSSGHISSCDVKEDKTERIGRTICRLIQEMYGKETLSDCMEIKIFTGSGNGETKQISFVYSNACELSSRSYGILCKPLGDTVAHEIPRPQDIPRMDCRRSRDGPDSSSG
jgi:hypothetical protein